MNDSRLTAVRLATDRRLFELFMENYVKALSMTTRRLFNHFTGSMDFQVSPINFKEGDTVINVTNWECSCAERLKTGVACSHLLACAIATTGKQYLDLFKKRWRTGQSSLDQSAEEDLSLYPE